MEGNIHLNSDELAHWGIKGMRWGIRRYQNKDGSLTPKGRKRYNEEVEKLKAEEKVLKRRAATKAKFDKLEAKRKELADKKKELDDAEAAAKGKKKGGTDDAKAGKSGKKSVKDMTDEELASALMRSRMESEYARLNPEPAPKEGFASRFVNDAVKPAAVNAGRNFLENAIKKMGEKALADKVDPDSLEAIKKEFEKLDYKTKIDKLKNPDKYLSEEDKNKRQEREQKKANWDAQMEGKGYADAKDKAEKEYAAREAANESARKANASTSQRYHDMEYKYQQATNPNYTNGTNVSSGKSWAQKLLGSGTTTTSLTTSSNVNSGRKYCDVVLSDGTTFSNLGSYEEVD